MCPIGNNVFCSACCFTRLRKKVWSFKTSWEVRSLTKKNLYDLTCFFPRLCVKHLLIQLQLLSGHNGQLQCSLHPVSPLHTGKRNQILCSDYTKYLDSESGPSGNLSTGFLKKGHLRWLSMFIYDCLQLTQTHDSSILSQSLLPQVGFLKLYRSFQHLQHLYQLGSIQVRLSRPSSS